MVEYFLSVIIHHNQIPAFSPKREKGKQSIENLEAVMEGEQKRFQLLGDEDMLALYQNRAVDTH